MWYYKLWMETVTTRVQKQEYSPLCKKIILFYAKKNVFVLAIILGNKIYICQAAQLFYWYIQSKEVTV